MLNHTGPSDDGRHRLISVIVCTRRRPDMLRRCLASLHAQDDGNFEVVVVDNVHHPLLDPSDIAAQRARVVHEPHVGLCFARNRGIAEARGEIVAFIDDDCEADSAWVSGLRRGFCDPAVAMVTGRAVAASMARRSHHWFERFSTFDRGVETRRIAPNGPPEYFFDAARLGSGCNMAFRHDILEKLGPFDTALDVGAIRGGGDLDYFERVLRAREEVVYAGDALVHHYHRDTMRALTRQLFGYGVGLGALCVKFSLDHPEHRSEVVPFFRRWLHGSWSMLMQSRLVARPLGFALFGVLVAGVLAAPGPYLWHRFARRRARA